MSLQKFKFQMKFESVIYFPFTGQFLFPLEPVTTKQSHSEYEGEAPTCAQDSVWRRKMAAQFVSGRLPAVEVWRRAPH